VCSCQSYVKQLVTPSDTITQLLNNYSRKFTLLSGFEIIRI